MIGQSLVCLFTMANEIVLGDFAEDVSESGLGRENIGRNIKIGIEKILAKNLQTFARF